MAFKGDDAVKFLQLMNALAATFNRDVDEALMMGYEMALDDLPICDISIGARRAIRECKFMPSGRELRDLAGAMPDEIKTDSRAVIAYAAAARAVQSVGGYQSVTFDDPLINAVVRNLGGWERFCDWPATEVQWRKRDFEQMYRSLSEAGVSGEMARPLDGICDRLPGTVLPPSLVESGLPPQRRGIVQGEPPKHISADVKRIIDETAASIRNTEPLRYVEPAPKALPPPELTQEELDARKAMAIDLLKRSRERLEPVT